MRFTPFGRWYHKKPSGSTPPSEIEIANVFTATGRSTEMVAPEGISFLIDFNTLRSTFSVSSVTSEGYDPAAHDLFYIWSFGDPGSFTAPVNVLDSWKNSNEAIGFRASHVYRTPGTYTVRLDIAGYVGGNIVRAFSTLNVTVNDPNTIFAGSKTYFVSPSSNWTNAPSGSQHVTSLDDACGWANEDGSSGPFRIMLNRGETYTFNGKRFGFNTTVGPTVHIIAGPGGGAAPVVTCTGGFSAGANDDSSYSNKTLVVQGLVMNGPYDPITPSNPEVTTSFSFWGPYSPQQILIDRCEMYGFGHSFYIGDSVSRYIYLNDCVAKGYGLWGLIGSHYTALNVTGCRIQSHENAPVDNGISGGGTFRLGGGSSITNISNCDFFCRQGWSGLGGGYIAVQPCIRLETEGSSGGINYSVTRTSLEGGFSQLTISRGDNPSVTVNAVLDSLYFTGGYQTGNVIGTSVGGVTVRNVVAVIPSTAQRVGPGLSSFIEMTSQGNPDVLNSPMKVYENTIINFTTDTLDIVSNVAGFTGVSNQNNVVYQPNTSPTQTLDVPITSSPEIWSSREIGYKDTTTPLITNTATPSGTVTSYSLGTGNPAIGSATSGYKTTNNINGSTRTNPPNRGAW